MFYSFHKSNIFSSHNNYFFMKLVPVCATGCVIFFWRLVCCYYYSYHDGYTVLLSCSPPAKGEGGFAIAANFKFEYLTIPTL